MKKRRKEERGRAGKRKGVQPRSVATTPKDKALQESEAEFRSLVENTAAPIGITNLRGDFTYVNKALADLTGYTVQEMVGRPFMEFLHPEDREAALKVFMKGVSASEEAREIEFRVIRRDGQILTLTSKPTRFEIDGKTVGFQAIITDITERKRVENALRQQRSMLEGIINSSDAPIFSVNKQYRYTNFNRAHASVMKAIYGQDIEIGKSLLDYMTVAEDREEAKRNLDRALAGELVVEEAYSGEETRSRLHFVVSHSPMTTRDGSIIGAAVFAKDITQRKRAEEQVAYQASLLANVNDAIISSDPRFILMSWNKGAEAMYGWKAEEVLGRLGAEVLRTEFPGTERPKVTRELAGTGEFHGEVIQSGRMAPGSMSK